MSTTEGKFGGTSGKLVALPDHREPGGNASLIGQISLKPELTA